MQIYRDIKLHQFFSSIQLVLISRILPPPVCVRFFNPSTLHPRTAFISMTWFTTVERNWLRWGGPRNSQCFAIKFQQCFLTLPVHLSVVSLHPLNWIPKGYLRAYRLRCITNPRLNPQLERTIVDHCPVEFLSSPNFRLKICIYVLDVTHSESAINRALRPLSWLFTSVRVNLAGFTSSNWIFIGKLFWNNAAPIVRGELAPWRIPELVWFGLGISVGSLFLPKGRFILKHTHFLRGTTIILMSSLRSLCVPWGLAKGFSALKVYWNPHHWASGGPCLNGK